MRNMSRKRENGFVPGFVLGFAAALVFILLWNTLTTGSYTRYGYMMPSMMQGMMGYGLSGQAGDCSKLNESELIDAGDTFMEKMMGAEFEQQIEKGMSAETSRLMHLMMGRMYYNC
ncbi:MAG: hypothetical protein HYS53_03355 [Candidatus Aenigmarchaeota archaeon]|nr:hypothetical protein [Candidatus Aenigmarchaeota archaeon]